jgi:hypothetical protein
LDFYFSDLKQKTRIRDGASFIARLRALLRNVKGRWIWDEIATTRKGIQPILLMTVDLINNLIYCAKKHAKREDLTIAQRQSFTEVVKFLNSLLPQFSTHVAEEDIAVKIGRSISQFDIAPVPDPDPSLANEQTQNKSESTAA